MRVLGLAIVLAAASVRAQEVTFTSAGQVWEGSVTVVAGVETTVPLQPITDTAALTTDPAATATTTALTDTLTTDPATLATTTTPTTTALITTTPTTTALATGAVPTGTGATVPTQTGAAKPTSIIQGSIADYSSWLSQFGSSSTAGAGAGAANAPSSASSYMSFLPGWKLGSVVAGFVGGMALVV